MLFRILKGLIIIACLIGTGIITTLMNERTSLEGGSNSGTNDLATDFRYPSDGTTHFSFDAPSDFRDKYTKYFDTIGSQIRNKHYELSGLVENYGVASNIEDHNLDTVFDLKMMPSGTQYIVRIVDYNADTGNYQLELEKKS